MTTMVFLKACFRYRFQLFNEPEVGLAETILPFPMAVLCLENGLWPPIADPCRDIGLDAIEALFRKETHK